MQFLTMDSFFEFWSMYPEMKGQVIARLDQTDFKIELKDKQASFDKSKANFTRSAKLLEPGHISQREFDEIKASYSTADAHLRAANQNLIYTELKSPFDGSITKTYVDNYEEIMAKGRIATLQDLKSMEVEIDVPESQTTPTLTQTLEHFVKADAETTNAAEPDSEDP